MYDAKCGEIVYFLALSGKHNVRPNVQILYQDAMISHGNLYVKTFKQMVDEVLYPSYQKRFQNRNDFINTELVSRLYAFSLRFLFREIEKKNFGVVV